MGADEADQVGTFSLQTGQRIVCKADMCQIKYYDFILEDKDRTKHNNMGMNAR